MWLVTGSFRLLAPTGIVIAFPLPHLAPARLLPPGFTRLRHDIAVSAEGALSENPARSPRRQGAVFHVPHPDADVGAGVGVRFIDLAAVVDAVGADRVDDHAIRLNLIAK